MSETILTTLQNKIGQILNTNAMDVHSCRKLYETYLEKYSKNCEILVSLYIAYTTNEIKFKQFKKAKSIYEIATSNKSIVNSTKLWISYAKFFANRNKQGSTRKTYLKAIKNITNSENVMVMWQHFLKYENRSKMVPMSLDELKQLVNETTTTSSGTSSDSSSSTQATAAGNNVNKKKRPLLSRPEVDSSKFKVANEIMLFVKNPNEKNMLPQLRPDTMSKLAYMFKLNTNTLFEIVLKMKELQDLLYNDLQLQGKIFENEVKYGNLRERKIDFDKKSGKELRRIRRQMQSLLMQSGVPEVYLTEDPNIIVYQQKILSVIVDAAILKARRQIST